MIRGAKKTLINFIFAPLRVPKITGNVVATLMKFCEASALLFVFVLLVHLSSPSVIPTFIVVVSGIVFAGLLGMIKFSDYQEKIEQYKYYGFRI